jgi:hypothetical protein
MLSGNLESQKMSLTIPKNKKSFWIFLAIAGLAVFLFAVSASASMTYSRNPTGTTLLQSSGLYLNLTGTTLADLNGGDPTCVKLEFWSDHFQSTQYNITAPFDETFYTIPPLGDYRYIKLHRTKADGYTYCGTDTYLEGDGSSVIFSVITESVPSPIPESVVYQVFPDTETYYDWGGIASGDTDFGATAEKYVPSINQQICSVETKIQLRTHRFNPDAVLYAQLLSGGTSPFNATPLEGAVAISPVASLSYIGEPITYLHRDFNTCHDLTGGTTYWVIYYGSNTTSTFRNYGKASVSAISFAWRYKMSQSAWFQIANFDHSFRLLNEYYQTPAPSPPPPSPPSTASYGFENKDFGLLGNMFRDVIVWLFYPSQDALNQFGNLYDTIKAKPPIGYFTAVQSELGYLGAGSASITFDTTAAAGIINPLRVGLIGILWIMFAFWIFHRLRNLDL